jgi:predicted AlkP superfamily phosphohydrolase/phosphomutase
MIPKRFQRALPGAGGTFDKAAKAERIDWERSSAVASGQGPIYLLIPPDDPKYERLRQEIIDKLGVLRNPVTSEPVVARVLRREKVYRGPHFEQAPDLIFEQGPGVHTSGGVGAPNIFHTPEKWAADNVLQGLFLAWGPDFASDAFTEEIRIIDLAPTILYVMGQPIPDDVDGRVLKETLAPESDAARRDVNHYSANSKTNNPGNDDEADITSRLSALGYLD